MWLQANDDNPPSASRAEYQSPHSQIKGRIANIRGRHYGLFHKEIWQKIRMCAEDRCLIFGVQKSCESCLSLFCVYYIVQKQKAREGNWMARAEIAGGDLHFDYFLTYCSCYLRQFLWHVFVLLAHSSGCLGFTSYSALQANIISVVNTCCQVFK